MLRRSKAIYWKSNQLREKNFLKFFGLLVLIIVILSACAAPPPAPVTKAQLDEAKATALDLEAQVASQNKELKKLEKEVNLYKKVELQNLKDYEQQLKDEGFLGEE